MIFSFRLTSSKLAFEYDLSLGDMRVGFSGQCLTHCTGLKVRRGSRWPWKGTAAVLQPVHTSFHFTPPSMQISVARRHNLESFRELRNLPFFAAIEFSASRGVVGFCRRWAARSSLLGFCETSVLGCRSWMELLGKELMRRKWQRTRKWFQTRILSVEFIIYYKWSLRKRTSNGM